jgi:hypothetical protein
MKKKFSKIFAVALTVTLLVSLILAAAPVSGKTLEWGKEVIIREGTFAVPYQIVESSDILDMVAAPSDGKLWAVMNDEVTPSAQLYRSTTSGKTWAKRSPAGTALLGCAVAPDDSQVVIAFEADQVYLSSENGEAGTWSEVGNIAAGQNLNTIFSATGAISCADISAKDGDGYRWMVVGGVDGAGVGQVAVGKMAALGGWSDYTDGAVAANWDAADAVLAVRFSPKFRYDETLLAVTDDTSASDAQLLRCDVGTPAWDATVGDITGTAATLVATGADISLPSTYYGVDDTERVAYISLVNATTGGVYRMDDTTSSGMLTGRYSAVAYNSDANTLLAGLATSGAARISTNPDATSPSFSIAPSLKRASGGAVSAAVWVDSTPLLATTGTESGVYVGAEDGKSWNGLSLLDSDLATITDIAISENGSVIYLAARDGNYCSIYRKQGGDWQRVLCEDMGAANTVLVRMAPNNTAAVFVAWAGTKDIRYSTDSGESWRRSESDITILDIEAKSDQIIFTMDASGQVSTSLDGGGFFDDYVKSLVAGDDMIVEPVTGDLIVIGASSGYVRASVSTDDGASFDRTPEFYGIADSTTATFVAADGDYANNSIIYAAQDDNIVRWEVGGDMEDWKDVTTSSTFPVATTDAITGLAFYGGALYAMYTGDLDGDADTDDSAFARTIEGTARTPTWIGSAYVEDSQFNQTPCSLRFSGGTVTVWAVNTTPATVDELYSYTDIVEAAVAPVLTGPADGYTGSVDAVLETINPVRFSWEEVDENTYYQLRLGTNEAVSVNYIDYSVASKREWVSIGSGTGTNQYPFVTGETYYWKVRVNSPVYGPWSEVRSFSVEEPAAAVAPAPQITVQAPPAVTPTITVPAPVVTVPAPQVTVEVPEAEVPPTPSYIWAIIAIGAILVIAVIVLIVRTRRPV